MASAERVRREQEQHQAQVTDNQEQLRRQNERSNSIRNNNNINNAKKSISRIRRTVSLESLVDSRRSQYNNNNKNDENKRRRPTMMLESLFERFPNRPKDDDEEKELAPQGVPVLYEWVQNDDGSITGFIRNSSSFRDGATISTSPVARAASEGTTITTASGSQ
jgi:hypothetical protein